MTTVTIPLRRDRGLSWAEPDYDAIEHGEYVGHLCGHALHQLWNLDGQDELSLTITKNKRCAESIPVVFNGSYAYFPDLRAGLNQQYITCAMRMAYDADLDMKGNTTYYATLYEYV